MSRETIVTPLQQALATRMLTWCETQFDGEVHYLSSLVVGQPQLSDSLLTHRALRRVLAAHEHASSWQEDDLQAAWLLVRGYYTLLGVPSWGAVERATAYGRYRALDEGTG